MAWNAWDEEMNDFYRGIKLKTKFRDNTKVSERMDQKKNRKAEDKVLTN